MTSTNKTTIEIEYHQVNLNDNPINNPREFFNHTRELEEILRRSLPDSVKNKDMVGGAHSSSDDNIYHCTLQIHNMTNDKDRLEEIKEEIESLNPGKYKVDIETYRKD